MIVVFRNHELAPQCGTMPEASFRTEQPADLAPNGQFGLMGMRERVLLYGGKLTIVSAPGQGAEITAHRPVMRQM
jgi:signal transduction histidine kinase